MKKYLLILCLIFAFSPVVFAEELEAPTDVNPDDIIFKTPLSGVEPEIMNTGNIDYTMEHSKEYSSRDIDPDNMPYFKQLRIRIKSAINQHRMEADKKAKNSPKKEWKILKKNLFLMLKMLIMMMKPEI